MLEVLAQAVDELVGIDVSTLCDSEIRETLIAARREIDRQEAFVAALLPVRVGAACRGMARFADGTTGGGSCLASFWGERLTAAGHATSVRSWGD